MNQKTEKTEWASLFGAALKSQEKRPAGQGWKTRFEIAEDLGIPVPSVKDRLRVLRKSGHVEFFSGTITSPEGRLVTSAWYRIKKGKK